MVFGPYPVEITNISTKKIIAKGIADHASKEYAFSHFMPYSDVVQPHLPFKEDEGITTPLLPIGYTYLLSNVSDSDSKEEEDQHDFDIEFTPQRDLDLDPPSTSSQQLIKAVGDGVGNLNDKRRMRSQY